MKNKKGFTLIKIGTIIIFILLVVFVAIPIILKVMDESKNKLYARQVKMIEKNSEKWGIDNINILSKKEDIYLNLSELVNGGYIQYSLKDPRNPNIELNGCILIKYDNLYSKYEYKYYEATCSELTSD